MAAESSVQKAIWGAVSAATGATLFRLNSGKAWLCHGQPARRTDGSILLPPGSRPVALGMGLLNGDPVVGQSDLYGWHSITITPEMVGGKIAVPVAIECKRTNGGRTSTDQKRFINIVREAGGIAGVANSAEAAIEIVKSYRPPFL